MIFKPLQCYRSVRLRIWLLLAATIPLAGCHRQQQKTALGSMDSPGSAASVDNSWVNAAKSCWPDLAKGGYGVEQIQQYLIVPGHLRSAFPSYAGLSDQTIKADITVPITTILPPDVTKLTNSSSPVLTTGQAVAGTPSQAAVVQSTHGNAPPMPFAPSGAVFPQASTSRDCKDTPCQTYRLP